VALGPDGGGGKCRGVGAGANRDESPGGLHGGRPVSRGRGGRGRVLRVLYGKWTRARARVERRKPFSNSQVTHR
jgi:hypothetical protein